MPKAAPQLVPIGGYQPDVRALFWKKPRLLWGGPVALADGRRVRCYTDVTFESRDARGQWVEDKPKITQDWDQDHTRCTGKVRCTYLQGPNIKLHRLIWWLASDDYPAKTRASWEAFNADFKQAGDEVDHGQDAYKRGRWHQNLRGQLQRVHWTQNRPGRKRKRS